MFSRLMNQLDEMKARLEALEEENSNLKQEVQEVGKHKRKYGPRLTKASLEPSGELKVRLDHTKSHWPRLPPPVDASKKPTHPMAQCRTLGEAHAR